MRALKLLVAFLAVLLAAGLVALGFGIAYRVNHPRQSEAPAASAAAPARSSLDLPAGARVVGAEASGNRLVVRVQLAAGDEELIIVDLATGAPVSIVTLRSNRGAP